MQVTSYLREVRPLFLPQRTFQRTQYRAGVLCQFDLWQPSREIPVGSGQMRRGYVVVGCLPYSRAGAGTLVFSKEAPDLLYGIGRCLLPTCHFRLPAFEPPPAVDAGVIVFKRRIEPLIPSELIDPYRRFVSSGFRRGLRTVAAALAVKRIAGRGAAARDLDTHQWVELFLSQRPLRKSKSGSH